MVAELEKLIALRRYPKVFVKISHTWSISKQPIVENVSTYERALSAHSLFANRECRMGLWQYSNPKTSRLF
jgi:hypothetical protein